MAVGDLRVVPVRGPHRYTLPSIRSPWVTLSHRWIQEIEESTNILRLRANVARPTCDQLKAIGMTIDQNTGVTICHHPTTFNVRDASGYFQAEIVRKMNAEKELSDRHHYHGASIRNVNNRTADAPEPVGLPGPPLTAVERRLAGSSSLDDKSGGELRWYSNSNLG